MSTRALLVASVLAAGCGPSEPSFVDGEIGVWREGLTVGAAGGCSTSIVAGLTQQLIDEQNCLRPGALVSFAGVPNVSVASGVNPFLEQPAVDALKLVASQGTTLDINSAFRSVAQQYLLYKWQGSCGIQIAAAPGNSNHETGIAIDVSNHDTYRAALEAQGWVWFGSADVVHFDFKGAPTVDLRGDSVLAFQKLWNLNNPGDPIAEDGSWGPMTEQRLAATDASGFAMGSTCSTMPPPPPPPPPPVQTEFAAMLVGQSAPPSLAPGAGADLYVDFKNTGTSSWTPGKTRLGTSAPHDRASVLASAGWLAPNRPATVDKPTKPGEVGRFAFHIVAPAESRATALSESFALVEEGVTWFAAGAELTLDLEVQPVPGALHEWAGTSSVAPAAGGCAVGGAQSPSLLGLALAYLLAWALRRATATRPEREPQQR